MENESSTALKDPRPWISIYQLVPPSNLRVNNAEREIQTLKNHFISGLRSVDVDFHLQLWDRMINQETISLNILRRSRIHPHLLYYTHTYGEFDYNFTPLYPLGTRVILNNRKNREQHGNHMENPAGTLDQPWSTANVIRTDGHINTKTVT